MISENGIEDDIMHMLTSGATWLRSHFKSKTWGRSKGKIKMCLFLITRTEIGDLSPPPSSLFFVFLSLKINTKPVLWNGWKQFMNISTNQIPPSTAGGGKKEAKKQFISDLSPSSKANLKWYFKEACNQRRAAVKTTFC